MTKLSVVINTLNEEKNLPRALASVKSIASEIIVVDMHSDDDTVKIAKEAGAKVYEHEQTNYVEPARNFAISKAAGDWILILDADEELPKTLKDKIKIILEGFEGDYYRIPRKNLIFNKWIEHTGWWPDYNIRLFRKGTVVWNEVIHTVPMTVGKGIDLDAKEEFAIIHHNYQSIEQYLDRLNRYTTIQAKLYKNESKDFFWQDFVRKPANEFLRRYFALEGYKDSLHGLALSILQAFSELVVILKVWQLHKFADKKIKTKDVIGELKTVQKDVNYWTADTLTKLHGGVVNKIKRRFKLS